MKLGQLDAFIGRHPLICIWFVGVIFFDLTLKLFWREQFTELFALLLQVNFYGFIIWNLVFSYQFTAYLLGTAFPSNHITGMWSSNAVRFTVQYSLYYGLLFVIIQPMLDVPSIKLQSWLLGQLPSVPNSFLILFPMGGLLFLVLQAILDSRLANWLVAAVDTNANHSISAAWRRSRYSAPSVLGKLLILYLGCFLLLFAIDLLTMTTYVVGDFYQQDTSVSTTIRTIGTFVLQLLKTVLSLGIIVDGYIKTVRPKPSLIPQQ